MDARHGVVTNLNIRLGQRNLEPVKEWRQAVQADAGARGHMKGLNAGRPDPGNLNAHLVGQPDNLAAVVMGDLAGVIQLQPAQTGHGQQRAEGFFHGVELVAGIGRGAVMEPGGIGEALGVRHVNEEPQRFQLHGDKGLIKTGNFVKRMMPKQQRRQSRFSGFQHDQQADETACLLPKTITGLKPGAKVTLAKSCQ